VKNNFLLVAILVIVVGAAGFFAGLKYQQSKQPSRTDIQSLGQFRRDMRQSGTQDMQPRGGSGMIRGEIINKDEKSITVKMPDNSSKIILLSENTKINKATEGSVDDLETGKQVVVFGQENPDKSISATNIQLDFGFREDVRDN